MHTDFQITCVLIVTGFDALCGLIAGRFLSRFLRKPENEVAFYGAINALIAGFSCLLVMGHSMLFGSSTMHLILSGLAALLSLLIYPLLLISSFLINLIIRGACDFVDGLFTR